MTSKDGKIVTDCNTQVFRCNSCGETVPTPWRDEACKIDTAIALMGAFLKEHEDCEWPK